MTMEVFVNTIGNISNHAPGLIEELSLEIVYMMNIDIPSLYIYLLVNYYDNLLRHKV